MEKFINKNSSIIIAVIMAFFAIVSILNAKNDSAIFDEIAHIPAGYSYVSQHDTRLNPEHPPLIKDIAGLPLLLLNLKFDTTQPFWTGDLPNAWDEGQWAAGRSLLYESGNDSDQIILWSRLPIVLLSILLGLFLFKWGKELAGTSAGVFALILYAFDPNILGHNHFVTTDLGVAAFLTFSFYYFLKFIKLPSWKNVGLGGLFLGFLLVSKFSSIIALPIFGLTLIIYSLAKNNRNGKNNWKTRLGNLGKYLLKGLAAFAVAAIVIWIVYKANNYAMPKETFDKTIDFFFAVDDSNPKATITNNLLHNLNKSALTRPWATYAFGPAWTVKRVVGGNGAYFMGKVGNGFTNYFPIVFLIKETIPFLFLALFALFFTFKQTIVSALSFKKIKSKIGTFLRNSVVEYSLFLFIVVYAYISIQGGLNIGFRHLFPILPLAYLLIAKKVFEFIKKTKPKARHSLMIIIAILVSWQIGAAMLAYPSYTSYFNESIGGSKNGYKYVTDSNTDWGQDLNRLKIWLDQHPEITKINIDYFGGGNPQLLFGDKYAAWSDGKRPVEAGWYAISENYLMGSIYDTKRDPSETYSWTRNYAPVDQIGKSILIYHVTKPLNQ
ncbi:MAG: glycosyltransferase family 39 protein [Candidatus Moraniibacteriota bacterium]